MARKTKLKTMRDPFEVIGAIPKNVAYQWVALSVMGETEPAAQILKAMTAAGWKPVPATRHPKMKKDKRGHVVVDSQILMQRPKYLSDEARDQEQDAARAMVREHPPGRVEPVYGASPNFKWIDGIEPRGSLLSAEQMQTYRDRLKARGGQQYVQVTICVLITEQEVQTAMLVLGLDPQEYMRRRIYMDTNALVLSERHKPYEDMPLFRRAEMFVKTEITK